MSEDVVTVSVDRASNDGLAGANWMTDEDRLNAIVDAFDALAARSRGEADFERLVDQLRLCERDADQLNAERNLAQRVLRAHAQRQFVAALEALGVSSQFDFIPFDDPRFLPLRRLHEAQQRRWSELDELLERLYGLDRESTDASEGRALAQTSSSQASPISDDLEDGPVASEDYFVWHGRSYILLMQPATRRLFDYVWNKDEVSVFDIARQLYGDRNTSYPNVIGPQVSRLNTAVGALHPPVAWGKRGDYLIREVNRPKKQLAK